MPSKNKPLLMNGLDPAVKIWEGESSESLDDKPTYQAANVEWTNDKKGNGGAYCEVGDVNGDKGTRDEDCWLPCFIS